MEPIVDICNVTHKYKGAGEDSIEGVSLSVTKGETLLLCGASGSGKTSVIRLINGLIPHYYHGEMSGDVFVKGLDVGKIELHELAGVVGTVFQNPRSQFFSVDTDGEIVFGPENIGLAPEKILDRKNMVVDQMDLEKLLGRSLFELSGGEKQRIACASVAALLPEIILLDEPSSNLDFEAIAKLHEIIREWKEQGKTIIISEHRLWYLKDLVDRVIYMDNGKISHEWTREEFSALSESETKKLKLRPTEVGEHFSKLLMEEEKNTDPASGKLRVGRSAFPEERTAEQPASRGGIKLKDFYFSYQHKPYILWKQKFTEADGDSLSLCIPELVLPKGKVIAVVGRNGTGKSTFLRCVCGLEKDCSGTIEIDGKTYRGKQRIRVSYMVMQDVNHQLFTDSVVSEVMLSMKEKDERRCQEILDTLGLSTYKDTHPMALSGGQKQRVAIASAIAAEAQILLFDEPTSGLDFAHMEKVGVLLRRLAASGKTVLVSTHDPELIQQCCDYELYIRKGRVVSLESCRQIENLR